MKAIISQNQGKACVTQRYAALVFENNPHALDRFRLRCPLWLFNTPLHIAHQEALRLYTFVLTDTLTESEIFGVFHLSVREDNQRKKVGFNPHRASFGSFEVAEQVSHADFGTWLDSITLFAQSHRITTIEIKHYPHCYHPPRSIFIRRGLIRNGFQISKTTNSQFIDISKKTFEAGLHPSERRRLRKCLKADFRFEEWISPPPHQVYDFILQNRQSLGYSLSFGLAHLEKWLRIFPEAYHIFCVKDKDTIASLTLAVRVGERVLYNFCPADHLAYRTYSPAVLLNKGLYEYAQSEGISILDLGVSTDTQGNSKPSLSRFKHNLGAKDSEKVVFEKEW